MFYILCLWKTHTHVTYISNIKGWQVWDIHNQHLHSKSGWETEVFTTASQQFWNPGKHRSSISWLGTSHIPWEWFSVFHFIINGLCLPLRKFLSLFLPVKGLSLNGCFHFELSVLWIPTQAGGAFCQYNFLKTLWVFYESD